MRVHMQFVVFLKLAFRVEVQLRAFLCTKPSQHRHLVTDTMFTEHVSLSVRCCLMVQQQ